MPLLQIIAKHFSLPKLTHRRENLTLKWKYPHIQIIGFLLTYVNDGVLRCVAALSLSVPLLLISDGSPGAVGQVLDLLNVLTRLFQNL